MLDTGGLWNNPDLVLYHGTHAANAESIVKEGIQLGASRAETDFGRGFYTTTSYIQAADWANKKALPGNRRPVVLGFKASRDDIALLEILAFVRAPEDAEEFWAFVRYCRSSGAAHARSTGSGWYNLVIGPVTKPRRFGRSIVPDFDQYSFHTDAALACLKPLTNA